MWLGGWVGRRLGGWAVGQVCGWAGEQAPGCIDRWVWWWLVACMRLMMPADHAQSVRGRATSLAAERSPTALLPPLPLSLLLLLPASSCACWGRRAYIGSLEVQWGAGS